MNLFEEKRWLGEFFAPGAYEKRFFGELNYAPDSGLELAYGIGAEIQPPETQILHGYLASGEHCTLFADFRRDAISSFFGNGKIGCRFMVLDECVEPTARFDQLSFTLTNLQEFFYPYGLVSDVKFSQEPLLKVDTSFGSIEVRNSAIFNYLSPDLTEFYSENDSALEEFKAAFGSLKKKYPDFHPMVRKEFAYRVRLNFHTGLSLADAYREMTNLADLFAVLTYRPVHPETIQVRRLGADEPAPSLRVYPYIRLDTRTVKLCRRPLMNHTMPITNSKIVLDQIIAKWVAGPAANTTLVTSLQQKTGFRTLHDLHGELILYCTQLESISYEAGNKEKKYEYALVTYASAPMRNTLAALFANAGLSDLGKAVGQLRDEIAHVKKPKILLGKLGVPDLSRISRLLELTILSRLLTKLDIPPNIIADFQERFATTN
ncbi:MAG TPA: hypothetical protein VN634_15000 [Candidatus Limnocylindrales bacterium]|nr:hypothetical protein [Candidatus Limnocylindrales bacterium]